MAAKNLVDKVLELSGKFVVSQAGAWEHDDWERFLVDAAKLGVELSDESRRNLGNILEAAKFFYVPDGPPPAKKAAAPRKKKA